MTPSTSSGILSAFSRDHIPGAIYIESCTLSAVRDILSGTYGVHSHRQSPRVELVPLDDRVRLLELDSPFAITTGSWVRLEVI
jgi:transcription elongation factor SPT5